MQRSVIEVVETKKNRQVSAPSTLKNVIMALFMPSLNIVHVNHDVVNCAYGSTLPQKSAKIRQLTTTIKVG